MGLFRSSGVTEKGERAESRTVNVGTGGLALASPWALLPGTGLVLELGRDSGLDQALRLAGKVAWTKPGRPPVLMGVEFTDLTPEQKAALERRLAKPGNDHC